MSNFYGNVILGLNQTQERGELYLPISRDFKEPNFLNYVDRNTQKLFYRLHLTPTHQLHSTFPQNMKLGSFTSLILGFYSSKQKHAQPNKFFFFDDDKHMCKSVSNLPDFSPIFNIRTSFIDITFLQFFHVCTSIRDPSSIYRNHEDGQA